MPPKKDQAICYICGDFSITVGHVTETCPKNTCKKCGEKGEFGAFCCSAAF